MPTYRIYYAEREPAGRPRSALGRIAGPSPESDAYSETEWEEEVGAPNAPAALDAFFKDHVRDNSELMWVDDEGESRAVEGLDYDSDKTYIWIEDGKLMEYQGLDEATPGMVSCPLCDGAGEVPVEIADEYLSGYEEKIVEEEDQPRNRTTWG